jgi:hypothetical protein
MGRVKSNYNWHDTNRLVFYDNSTYETLLTTHPVVLFEDFLASDEFLEDSIWQTAEEGTGNAVGITAAINGILQIDTGTAADKRNAFFGGLNWKAAYNCGVEMRITSTTSQAGLFLVFGFSDVGNEATGNLAFSDGSLASGSVDSVAEDAVMFGVRQETSADIYALSVKGDGTPQSTDSGTDIATDTYHIYRIQTDSNGNARYFIDGEFVAEHTSAVTASDPLVPTVQAMITTGSTAAFVNVDYIKVWQDRS